MYNLLNNILSDRKGGVTFYCFSIWHYIYIIATVVTATLLIVFLSGKSDGKKEKVCRIIINIAFGLYIADFFLMPLAYGEIDIEKLPFHICTATCILCFLSTRYERLGQYRSNIAMLAFISNLVYLIYPAGVMWQQVHPLSYRVVQTLVFHSIMTVYGLCVLVFNRHVLEWKKCYRDLIIVSSICLWAVLGNIVYNGSVGDYNHFFNWFFVMRDPFYIIPEGIAPYIMPFLNIMVFFTVENLIYLIHNVAIANNKNDN